MDNILRTNIELLEISNRNNSYSNGDTSTYNIFHGINALGGIPALPHNSDNQGLVFFTKPHLNLSYDNVISIRKLAFLADNNINSMGCLIKCMLNPLGYSEASDRVRSSILDDKCAFIPISNLLLSLSNPPDYTADTYTTTEGYNKEQVAWIDSRPGIWNVYDLQANFANMEGDPITTIFDVWIEYAQRVAEGSMLPFPINIVENRIDYQTRIYRLILDRTRTYVQKIWACCAAFPYTNPIGAVMGYNSSTHITTEANQIQITFKCIGSMFNEPILIKEFNELVGIFNPSMKDSNRVKMVKVNGVTDSGLNKKALLKYKMYPFIAPSMELEWYAFKDEYDLIMQSITSADKAIYPTTAEIINPWNNVTLEV